MIKVVTGVMSNRSFRATITKFLNLIEAPEFGEENSISKYQDDMHTYFSKIKAHRRLHGIGGASASILVACLDKLGFSFAGTDRFARFLHLQFDRKMNVQTAEFNEHLEADIPTEAHQDAQSYEASPAVELFQILESLPVDSETTFVDIGCGKGKAMLIAALFPFGKLEGVELSRKLSIECEKNFDRASRRKDQMPDCNVFCCDASKYNFPETKLVVYLFNPFGQSVLQQVLANLQRSLEKHSRGVQVIYCNAVHHDCFDENDSWAPTSFHFPLGRWWKCYQNVKPE